MRTVTGRPLPPAPIKFDRPVPPEADSLFRQGKALIEANCGECYQAKPDALRHGIDDVTRALDRGLLDSAEAHARLADAYRGMAYAYSEPDSPEQKEWEARLRESLEIVARLRPTDPAALYQFALSLPTPDDRIAALERVIQTDSTHALASYVLGLELVDQGDTVRGLPLLYRAGLGLKGPDAQAFVPRVILLLREHGHAADADSVAKGSGRQPGP